MAASTQWLKGHKDSVTCVAVAPGQAAQTLASSSLDSTVRVWDVSQGRSVRSVNCFEQTEDGVSEVVWCGEHTLAAASGSRVYYVDLRAHGASVIVRGCDAMVPLDGAANAPGAEAEDGDREVHSLCTHAAAGRLVAGTGTGELFYLPLTPPRAGAGGGNALSLEAVQPHTNVVSGVGACAAKPRLAWSVSMDCTLSRQYYDEAQLGAAAAGVLGVPSVVEKIELPRAEVGENQGRVVNPPLPACLSVCDESGNAALGLMDGSVWVFDEDLEPDTVWSVQGDVPVEALLWAGSEHLWAAARSGYTALYRIMPPLEEEEEGEEGVDASQAAEVVTALQTKSAVSCLARAPWLSMRQVLAGDLDGNIALHTLPHIAELSQ